MAEDAFSAVGRLQRLAALAAALVRTQTVAQVSAALAEHVQEAVGADAFSLREIDRESGTARLLVMHGVTDEYRSRFGEIDLKSGGALAEAAETGGPLFLSSAHAYAARFGQPAAAAAPLAAGVSAIAVLPLVVEGELIAVLSVAFRGERDFDVDERLFLTTVGDLAAQSLSRALRAERSAHETDRAQRLGGLAAALVGAQEVEGVAEVLAQHLRAAVGGQTFSLRRVQDGEVCAAVRLDGPVVGYRERFAEVRLEVPSSLQEVARTGRPVFVTSAEDHSRRYGPLGSVRHAAAGIEGLARLPLSVADEPMWILSVGYWQPQEFPDSERLFLTTVADLAAQALGRALRGVRLRLEARRHRLLSAAQAAISRRLEPVDQLRALARSVVPELADSSTVHVLATPVRPGVLPPLPVLTNRVASEFVSGVQPAPIQDGLAWWAGDPIVETICHGELLTPPMATPTVPEWANYTGTVETFRTGLNHVVLAPVLVDGLVVAVASFGMCHDRLAWDAGDLAIIEAIAGHAATALEHGLDYQHTRETALVLQRGLLAEPPVVDGLEIAVRYQPAGREEVGGDWYDAVHVGPGRVALSVGDVVGHDIHAAAAMGQLRAALHTLALDEFFEPGGVLRNLSQVNDSLGAAEFATALFARLSQVSSEEWELTWAVAGHPPPLLIEPDGRVVVLDHVGGVALVPGLDVGRPSARAQMRTGATLLLYTDGLVERRGIGIDESIAALAVHAGVLAREPLEELCSRLLREADGSDDAALLGVRIVTG